MRSQCVRTVSGSDTDVSTSAENLTHEEKYVLSHTERQDPQMHYNSLERLLREPPHVNGKETKPAGGALSDKSNSSSSSQLAPAEPDLNRGGDPLRPPGQYREPPDYVAANANEMMQILMLENSTLKQEIEMYQRKVQKLQKFARELEKLQSDYDDLVETCRRREQLEYLARQKLTSEVRRATDLNNSLSSQLDTSKLDEDKKQTDRRELLIQQLVTQNKELQAVKERQEIELTAQRATLQEQRQYIDILDTALTKAQENVVRVEKEHAERAAHKKIRTDLEREIADLKAAVAGKQGDDNGNPQQSELADMRQKLRDAHERTLLLETELAHCQQKFVDSTRDSELMLERSVAHLEPGSLHLSGSHPSLEERVLGLEARLVEKDAMIRALQKHALEVPAILRNPHSRQSSLQSLAGMNASSYGVSQHGYSSSVYSSSPGRPPGSTNAGSMINMSRLHTDRV
ncbi:angiomotin-like protein 1 [Pollicipes pollicipes]|uniref:angiomotin-like protein 1 n=1 Tax=Pollicipes pollicipes TaxID=41117 RepID=UPI0018856115|nr:angiomotin-like protein 1 [Pollicipes pollicipes]